MVKSQFDYSSSILENARRLGKDPEEVRIADLVSTKTELDESMVAKYAAMDSLPPPILVIRSGNALKIVDGHHRVAAAKRKGVEKVLVFVS